MTNSQLIAYVKVASDLENAIYACEEVLVNLQSQKKSFFRLAPPDPPAGFVETSTAKPNSSESTIAWVVGIALVFFLYKFLNGNGDKLFGSNPGFLMSLLAIIAPLIIAYLVYGSIQSSLANSRENKDNQEKHQQAEKLYTKRMEHYNQAAAIEETALACLDNTIKSNEDAKYRLQQQLKQLYSKGIIHPSLQNLVPINLIYRYLSLGVCDALEGPQGAYHEYLKDERVQALRTSIDDFRRSMEQHLRKMLYNQTNLIEELKTANQNVLQLTDGLSSEFYVLRNQLSAAHNAQAGSLSAANAKLAQIQSTIKTAAYNDYISLRYNNAKNYLLRNP